MILADPESTLGQAATALILGGTSFSPLPEPEYIAEVEPLYLPGFPGFTPQFLVTPSKLFPFTGLDSLTFDTSVGLGAANLHAAIMTQYQAGYDTVVFATSQSATVATLVMRQLMSLPADMRPGPDDLFFTLTGNPNRPDGGFLSRFAGQYIKEIGFTFFGATPADAYPTTDYAIQYDAAADFPLYPLNFFATANAIAGFLLLHPLYTDLTPAQLAAGVVQPVSPQSLTTYILIPSEDLPLLYPLRAIPVLGDPLADLIQPNLRVLVELGYERTAYQDVPRPFGLFPDVDWATVAADLQQGAVQGVNDALAELGWPPPIPALPRFP
nr:PE-PPE domain-containing protein [Mycobacterium decipiens]